MGVKRGKLLEIEDMDRKGHRTLGSKRNIFLFLASAVECIWKLSKIEVNIKMTNTVYSMTARRIYVAALV